MCGRTTLTVTADDLERAFGYPAPVGYRPRFNIAPSQELLAIGGEESGEGFRSLRWGLVPSWADDPRIGSRMINARAETIATKPAFRQAFARRRCLVVVDGFYEWRTEPGRKRPHRIRLRTEAPFTLAAIWERWKGGSEPLESCAIVTTAANPVVDAIHARMPVIVPPADRRRWLDPGAAATQLRSLLRPYEGEDLEAYEVSILVNNPANDNPACIEPLTPPLPPEG
jgi:putative SOS response-associated peptidase YedK